MTHLRHFRVEELLASVLALTEDSQIGANLRICRMGKVGRIFISAADRERLERLVRDRNTPQKVVWRARIVLLASDGLTAGAIAVAVGKSVLTVRRWRRRYVAKGVDGLLKDVTRPPRRKPLAPVRVEQVVHMRLHEKPADATHWSARRMAAATGLSHTSVQRIWHAHGLKPHLVERFKVSRDKNFAAKVVDQAVPPPSGRAEWWGWLASHAGLAERPAKGEYSRQIASQLGNPGSVVASLAL